jgi:nucleoside-diphosphate-sugar epimerase
MTQASQPIALVIGATGGIGGALADRLAANGWRVRAMNRNPDPARAGRPDLEWVKGDAMDEADVVSAAEGAQIIVHAVNPAGYKNWAGLLMPMLNNTIAAARASGARILFPGNVYNYGEDALPLISETSPQTPISRKGAIRVQMELALRAAAEDGVRSLIVRAGDFFGPRLISGSWLSQGLLKPGRPATAVTYPGPLEIPHAWAYLPDLAETFVRLLDTDLGPFEVFHFQGQQVTGRELVEALEIAAERKLPIRRLPWFVLIAISPFNEMLREMLEMKYLWDRPVLLDNSRLVAKLGAEPRTVLPVALRAALAGMGSLPAEGLRAAA